MSARKDGAFDAELVDVLADVEDDSFWFRSRNDLIVSTFRRVFPTRRTFLEIGCGTGFVLRGLHDALPELTLTGAELSAEGLEVARRRLPDVELLELDMLAMPYEGAFDVVGAFDVLEHIEQDERALSGILRRFAAKAAFCSPCRSTRGCGARSTRPPGITAGTRETN